MTSTEGLGRAALPWNHEAGLRRMARLGAVLLVALSFLGHSQAEPLNLALPTDNDAIYRGDGPEFYQYVERNYQGVKSTPWEGGQYGFVRDPTETAIGM